MNKKIILGSAAVVGALAAGVILPVSVFAANTNTNQAATFVQKLAAKLGVDQSTVQSAVDSTRTEMQVEHQAQFKTDVAQAVTDGKLTQRQADILLAIQDIQLDVPATAPEDLSGLTGAERQAKMEELRTQREQAVVDALNAKSLNTNLTEVQAAREAARTAGLRGGLGGRHGPGGMGMMF